MIVSELIDKMSCEGDPLLRFRVLNELLEEKTSELGKLKREVEASNTYGLWLDRLRHCTEVHNGTNDRFENIVGKLTELGVSRDFNSFHREMKRFLQELAQLLSQPEGGMWYTLKRSILAMGLARAGYFDEDPVLEATKTRIEEVYRVIKDKAFDVFVPPNEESKKPAHFRKHRLLNRFFSPTGNVLLPYIYDIQLFAAIQPSLLGNTFRSRINRILEYVLEPEYQKLPGGYGVCLDDHDGTIRYFSIGWAVHLPGFFSNSLGSRDQKVFLMRLEALSKFECVLESDWFSRMIAHSQEFRNEDMTYKFPAGYLTEMKEGYWILGNHMRIQEDWNARISQKLESTFRMLKILNYKEAGQPRRGAVHRNRAEKK